MVEEDPSKNLEKEKEKERPRVGTSLNTHTRDIKCFKCLRRGYVASQCPTKRIVILRDVDMYSSQNEKCDGESEDECKNKSEDAYPCNGDLLMIKKNSP